MDELIPPAKYPFVFPSDTEPRRYLAAVKYDITLAAVTSVE